MLWAWPSRLSLIQFHCFSYRMASFSSYFCFYYSRWCFVLSCSIYGCRFSQMLLRCQEWTNMYLNFKLSVRTFLHLTLTMKSSDIVMLFYCASEYLLFILVFGWSFWIYICKFVYFKRIKYQVGKSTSNNNTQVHALPLKFLFLVPYPLFLVLRITGIQIPCMRFPSSIFLCFIALGRELQHSTAAPKNRCSPVRPEHARSPDTCLGWFV